VAFIRTISPSDAEGRVREMYQEARRRFGYVPNWAQAFSLRPDVRDGWSTLLRSIQSNLPVRSYELATLAAARALRSSYCCLAHGSVLADKVFDATTVTAIMKGEDEIPLEPGERAMMAFAEKVVQNADRISSADIEVLRAHGYRDEEIFDIAAAAAARCFFSKLLDALGVQPDSSFNELDPALRQALTVGRPVADRQGNEIVSTRHFDAPREIVFGAFTDPAMLVRWWGPKGFTNTFHEFDLRPGGAWRFVMHGPDGTDYEVAKRFVEVAPPAHVIFDHVEPMHRFRMTMAFADESGGTRVIWRMRFESAPEADKVRELVAAANEENFDRLQALLTANRVLTAGRADTRPLERA
jgi:uncharacterized peroxidase-related enzyme